jgi:hypothetical protein
VEVSIASYARLLEHCSPSSTMFPAMSHVDEDSVAAPKDPFWTDEIEQSVCLLLVAWHGELEREAWLRNFVAGPFELTGHLAHALRRSGSHARSTTFDMNTIYSRPVQYDDVEEQAGSDTDMGF